MVLLEFSMFPVGEGESLSAKVARSIDAIDQSGVSYQMNAMGTILEGEWDEVFAVVRECYERMRQDSNRISAVIKLDWRKDKKNRLRAKVEAVEKQLGRTVHK